MDLKFSKDKLITCIDWHPTIRGNHSSRTSLYWEGGTLQLEVITAVEQAQ